MSIAGKSIIITGASSGIGAATAKVLAERGAKLMLAARREDRLKELVDQLGEPTRYRVTDVSNHDDMLQLGEETEKCFGKVDVLVNNAGIMPLSFFTSRKVEEWDRMIDVNIKGVLYGVDAVLPSMMERGDGHIINVSSVAGHKVRPSSGVYAGTKYAVRAISEGLRQECAGKVRVTTISPGAVATELATTITDEAVRSNLGGTFDFDFLSGEDIANAIAFAIEAPNNMAVNEILVRPIGQPH